MSDPQQFHVEAVEYLAALPQLRSVREPVFVEEQKVPLELEWDELDPHCHHVLARDGDGAAIGTGRLTPERKIGRMAVLAPWRGRGVGDALLTALMAQARRLGWREISLHAQVSAIAFYARHGFLSYGPRFEEAGIQHQSMKILLDAVNPVESHDAALAAILGVIGSTRRSLLIYSRELDPGLLDTPEAMSAFRRLATGPHAGQVHVQVLLQDPAAPQRSLAPLIAFAQRMPSRFSFRAVEEPNDRAYASAYIVDDTGSYFFRPLGNRYDGETRLAAPARGRQLRAAFDPVWQRARPCTEYRALGL
ncbi:MAG: GNAT family N-acetyltransferase [Pseudomonadota bacterium]|nr:GNAT family N-acetyltransferase [Pseudomonadota bacterium]